MQLRGRELSVPARLVAFAALLAVVGGGAALAGKATGQGRPPRPDAAGMEMADAGPQADGLASAAGGYRVVPERTTLVRGRPTAYRFSIRDADGTRLRHVDLDGGVRVHLIVVRRDFVGYQHLHPTLGRDGSWSVPLTLSSPGAYRAFADFEVDGRKTVLGTDLFVPGRLAPVPLPAVSTTASVDGFTVALAHPPLRAGEETRLRFDVGRAGRPVQSFDTYVGHRGHLVALRDGDLAYSHVHPEPRGPAGEIAFDAGFDAAGRYRLFLQFKVDGVVHTAAFTVAVS